MTGRDAAVFEQFLDRLFEIQEPQRVGDRRAIFSRAFRNLLLREMKPVGQSLKGPRLLDRIQIFALKIFNQRHLERHFIWHFAHYRRHAAERRPLSGAPPAFPGN